MSFPNIIYGDYGDEKVTSTAKIGSLPLGTRMVLPDGRIYAHALAGGTAIVAGHLYQGGAALIGTGGIKSIAVIAGSAVAGNTTLSVTAPTGTAITTDQFADGYVFSAAASTAAGIGWIYKIKTCSSAAAASTSVLGLYETDPIKVSLAGGTTTVGLRQNEFSGVTDVTSDTVAISTLGGLAAASCAASSYFWALRRGPGAALTDNTTLVVGVAVTASTTVTGAVGKFAGTADATSGKGGHPIGYCMSVASSSEYSLIDLALE